MKLVYQEIASLLIAIENCDKSGNAEWAFKHDAKLQGIVREYLPSGSGIDSGTTLDMDKSKPDKLVFNAPFHHMNDGGYYDGWTEHQIIITPSLFSGFDIHITGRDRNAIKDYLAETYDYALRQEIKAA